MEIYIVAIQHQKNIYKQKITFFEIGDNHGKNYQYLTILFLSIISAQPGIDVPDQICPFKDS